MNKIKEEEIKKKMKIIIIIRLMRIKKKIYQKKPYKIKKLKIFITKIK